MLKSYSDLGNTDFHSLVAQNFFALLENLELLIPFLHYQIINYKTVCFIDTEACLLIVTTSQLNGHGDKL